MATDATSLTLLERVRNPDAVAWPRLVDRYRALVFSSCRRCGLGDEDTADTIQEVFATVAVKLPSVEVCGQLGMTAGAVRQARYKVLRRLRAELGDSPPKVA
jgi:DNA-directed RNA polymerase specialized sigma24 family protein